jgi:hypothetical protein
LHGETARVHRLDRFNRVEAVSARRRKVELFAERVEKGRSRAFPDAHRAVALHVRMAAHGADARARLSELPAQK